MVHEKSPNESAWCAHRFVPILGGGGTAMIARSRQVEIAALSTSLKAQCSRLYFLASLSGQSIVPLVA